MQMNLNNINEEIIWNYFEDKATDDEIQALSEWVEENKSNQLIFAVMKKVFIEIETDAHQCNEKLGESRRNKFFDEVERIDSNRLAIIKDKKFYIRKTIFRYAAAIIIGLGVYFLGYQMAKPDSNDLYEVYVPYGGRSTITLPDGSKIWLNAGSTLKYNRDFDINSREVYIEGEAFFDIEKQKHPLIVHTSHFDIHVLGTTFNVKSYPEEDFIETTLVEGNIKIESNKYAKSVLLKSKQKLTYLKATNTIKSGNIIAGNNSLPIKKDVQLSNDNFRNKDEIEIYEDVNIEEATSWKDGKLIINNESLELLARKLERKYNTVFIFESEDLKKYSYSGTLRDFPLEQVLKALELTSPIKYTIEEKTVSLAHNENFKHRNSIIN